MRLTLRQPEIGELAALGELCMRSKATWGYDQKFMEACRGELSFSIHELKSTHIAVVEESNNLIGVAQVKVTEREADLLKLFVEPKFLRTGIGKLLFRWAEDVARDMGCSWLLIEADPGAASFYRHMGARDVGLAPSASIVGRKLPKLALSLH